MHCQKWERERKKKKLLIIRHFRWMHLIASICVTTSVCQCWSSWLFLILILFSNPMIHCNENQNDYRKKWVCSLSAQSTLFKLMSSAFCGIQFRCHFTYYFSFHLWLWLCWMLDINSPFFPFIVLLFVCVSLVSFAFTTVPFRRLSLFLMIIVVYACDLRTFFPHHHFSSCPHFIVKTKRSIEKEIRST